MNIDCRLSAAHAEAALQSHSIDAMVLEKGVKEAHLQYNVSNTYNMTRCNITDVTLSNRVYNFSDKQMTSLRLYDRPVWHYPSHRRFCYLMAQRLRFNDKERQRKCREKRKQQRK